jgi:hypothetical protein
VDNQEIIIRVATQDDKKYSTIITDEMESSAKARGTGIAKRSPEYMKRNRRRKPLLQSPMVTG